MRFKPFRSVVFMAVVLAWLASALRPSPAHAKPQTPFGGAAVATQIAVPVTGMAMTLADTGPLPEAGGGLGAALLSANVPGNVTGGAVALTAGTLHAAIVALDRTQAEASIGGVTLAVSGNGIAASFLMARSEAGCDVGPAVTGSSQLADLVINGHGIAVTGAPNQTLALPNGTVVINEQVSSASAGSGQLVVNALHVITRDVVTGLPLADVVLASADAHVQCQSSFAWSLRRLDFLDTVFAQTERAQFTTGGGWIPGNVGDKGTFGFVAGVQADGTLTGHVVYIDHSVNFGIESTQITAFTPGCTTNIAGTAATRDGSSVRFHLTVQDNGEPGRHDTFDIQVTDDIQYANGNVLGGGNIQADGTFAGGRVLSHGPSCL